MAVETGQCPYIFKDDLERQQCEHPVYKDHGYCVFHSTRIEEKADDFYKAIAKWIVLCTTKLDAIDLRGFVVPEMKLEDIVFQKLVDFRDAKFIGNILLNKVVFAQGADFSNAVFSNQFILRKSAYQDTMRFHNTAFEDDIDAAGEHFDSPVFFAGAKFYKNADFSTSTFQNNCDFRESFFSSKANMKKARFVQGAEFSESVFADDVDFSSSQLDQSTDFRGTQFKGDAIFAKARFSELASFWMSTFGGNAVFRESYFAGNVIFWMCNFTGIADFRKASFHQRAEFKGATFHNEIMLNQSRLQFLKELDAKGVNMEGTILNASHFWGVSRLENYSFEEAFLLSNNFAGKEFVDCDFTAATFASVHTKDWILDEATVKKTRFIFTDFIRDTELDDYGQKRDIYRAREDSRIPAKGFFNEGQNAGFTLADVFKQWKQKHILLEIPSFLHGAFIQYFALFQDYGRLMFQEDILAKCIPQGENLRIQLCAANDEEYEMLDARMSGFLKPLFTDSTMEFPSVGGDSHAEISLYRLKQACNNLHTILAMFLEEVEHNEQDALLVGLRGIVRDWSLLTKETTESDANLDAYFIEMFRTDLTAGQAASRVQASKENAPVIETPADAAISDATPATLSSAARGKTSNDIDTILEVKFTLDDLEHALMMIRDSNPQLGVKINGIQREISRVRDEPDDSSHLAAQQTRIAKIIQRTGSLLASHPDDASGAVSEVNNACRKINDLITA